MSKLVLAETVQLMSAAEATFNVQPTTGWRQHQPNADGIQGFDFSKIKKVARSPLSANRQNYKGDIVDFDAEVKVVHDLNKEWLDYFGSGTFLSNEKFNGGTGTGRFAVTTKSPGEVALTAVGATSITVASGGALPAGVLVYGRGFSTSPANNALFVVGAASTGTSITIAGGTVDAAPAATAMVEVAGVQGASGDITATVSGTTLTLGSTTLSFLTLGLQLYQWIWVGGGTLAAPGAFGYTAGGPRGWVRITSLAAHTMTCDRFFGTPVTDSGAGKTIQIFFGSFIRNTGGVNGINGADYIEQSYSMEVSLPGIDTSAATGYQYGNGFYVDTLEVNVPAVNKIVVTTTFKGTTITDETTSRSSGPSTAPQPFAVAAFNGVTELPRIQIVDATATNYNANITVDIDSFKLTAKNNCTAQKQLGTFGPARIIPGKFTAEMDITAFLVQPDAIHAIKDNRTLMFQVGLRNNDAGALFDIPAATLEGGALKEPQNGPVTIQGKLMAFQDTNSNFTLGLTKFPFLPAN